MSTHSILTLNIKTLDSKVWSIKIPSDASVPELKSTIRAQLGIDEEYQRLIFQGKVLKDDKNLSFYAIKDGHTIHMVQAPSRPTTTPTPMPSEQTERNVSPSPAQGNLLLGSITPSATPAPDLSQLFGSMLNTLGIPFPSQSSTPSSATSTPQQQTQDGFHHLNRMMNNLNSSIAQLHHTEASLLSLSSSTSTNTENITLLLQHMSNNLTVIQPYVSQLASLVQQEQSIQDGNVRQAVQQLAHSLAPIAQQLGALFVLLSYSLSSLRVSENPGQLSVQPPPPSLSYTVSPTAIVQSTDSSSSNATNTNTTATASSSAFQRAQSSAASSSIPLFTITQRAPSTATTTTTPTTASNSTATMPNVANLMSMMSTLMGGQGSASSTSNRGTTGMNNNIAQLFDNSNPAAQQSIQNLFQMVNGLYNSSNSTASNADVNQMIQQLHSGFQSLDGSSAQQQQPQTAMLNQLLNTFSQLMAPPNTSSNTTTAPSVRPSINNNTPTNTPLPAMSVPPNTAAVMSQAFNAVNQAMTGGAPSSVSSVIGSIAQGISPYSATSSAEDTVLGELFSKVMDTLTIPDMLSIMNGNWVPVQTLHPLLRDYILQELLKGDTSSAAIEEVTDTIMDSIKPSLNEKFISEDIKKKVKNGYEISTLTLQVFRRHTLKLINLILSPLPPSPVNPHPFAVAVKEWTAAFVDELVTVLSESLHDGISDTSLVIKLYLQERLAFMGPEFAQMGTNMVTSYIMKTYSSTKLSQDPQTWSKTIAVDEMRQSIAAPQKPFGDSYLSGAPVKTQKAAKIVNTDPKNLLKDRLRDALNATNINVPASAKEALLHQVSEQLSEKYLDELSADIKQMIERDSSNDFSPSRYPLSFHTFIQKKH